jgi:hypothetical protein
LGSSTVKTINNLKTFIAVAETFHAIQGGMEEFSETMKRG